MLIIAMNRVLIMHESIHIHVIMNIIVNPRLDIYCMALYQVYNFPPLVYLKNPLKLTA